MMYTMYTVYLCIPVYLYTGIQPAGLLYTCGNVRLLYTCIQQQMVYSKVYIGPGPGIVHKTWREPLFS